jgi:DNA polymerase-3 subunit chi
MTRIDFYTHVDDKLRIACALCNKAIDQGLRVNIFTPDPQTTNMLDKLLWTTPPTGFIPHCRPMDPLAADTPVIIHHETEGFALGDVLVNLHGEWPPFFSRFERLVEIVSTEEEDAKAARSRYKFYRDRGYQIESHQVGKGRKESR